MYERKFSLKTINDVYDFSMAIQKIDCDIDLMTEHRRYIVDGKSVMGIFSLDLSKPIILKAYTDNPEIIAGIDGILSELDRTHDG